MQRLLDIVYAYACKWRLTYNSSKSVVLLFDNGKTILNPLKLKLGGNPIEQGDEVTYAGTLISTKRSTRNRTKAVCMKARRHINSLQPYHFFDYLAESYITIRVLFM